MTQTETKKPDQKANGPKDQGKKDAPFVHAEDETKSLAIYDPKAEEGWQVLDTGEGRVYWHRDPEADPEDTRTNVITGFATDVGQFQQENQTTGELETRHFIVIQTTAPTYVVGEEKDARGNALPTIAPKGTLVWVGVTHALQSLHRKVQASSFVLEVQIKGVELIKLASGRKVWRLAQAVRATKKQSMVEARQRPMSEETPF